MVRRKQLIIWALCGLMVLESSFFVNTGLSKKYGDELIIGGSHGSTYIYLSGQPVGRPGSRGSVSGVETGGKPGSQADQAARVVARKEAEKKGLLILVNKDHPVDKSYKPEDLASIRYFTPDRSKESRYMRKEAAEQFHKMVEAAAEAGYTIRMTTAYRSYGFQQILWNNYVLKEGEEAAAKYSARPGQSEHQTGLAVDVTSPSVNNELVGEFGDSEEGMWLSENAHKFGFILRYPKGKEEITGYQYEPWHLRYVGETAANELFENDLTLEEYLGQ